MCVENYSALMLTVSYLIKTSLLKFINRILFFFYTNAHNGDKDRYLFW